MCADMGVRAVFAVSKVCAGVAEGVRAVPPPARVSSLDPAGLDESRAPRRQVLFFFPSDKRTARVCELLPGMECQAGKERIVWAAN
jgi:hypothetical protein